MFIRSCGEVQADGYSGGESNLDFSFLKGEYIRLHVLKEVYREEYFEEEVEKYVRLVIMYVYDVDGSPVDAQRRGRT